MTLEELNKILDLLDENQPNGLGVLSLAQKSGIEVYLLRKYLATHTEYFVQLPDKKVYTINKFGQFKGSKSKMVQHYKARVEQQPSNNYELCLLMFSACFVALVAVSVNAT
ncbi:hypothetical protein NB564_12875 [Vibrio parahaemolyticus]|uniref:hypothetical protein n=1 Tax=Vibrio parahaemolyticus TaxID=670 RepID=UPI00215C52F3|nr:hypothetical protein [Vibrio parahaemolyticus]MCR9951781.1 hypothetical protein [Vibrio parahaemolyticus]